MVTLNGNNSWDYNLEDYLYGTDSDDLITLFDGNDDAFGGYGNDQLFGGYGDDVLDGDEGSDHNNHTENPKYREHERALPGAWTIT